ncbi:response regulator transcription factor [Actinocrispum wychmicini]|uniref:DNA-binding NarL/FixJ family response regulator n=1 Tax=Actinocrispum wychmicini TaxID=1213861 RepID=A0A4R2JG84_9PSEU|nr:response regulator transcription factor [Actinocrispum wychmicini]TCO55916.1 DNA-binding NarL/FixJ family response regulator [Actinocrispum wychmicini]
MTTRVIVVDDQDMVRAGFVSILTAEPDIEVVDQAGDGATAIQSALTHRPHVVVMDIRMPVIDGTEATRRILEAAGPAVAVLVLTSFDVDEHVYSALRAGAAGYLLKDAPPEELIRAVRAVAAGQALLAPSVARRLIDEFVRTPVSSGEARLRLSTLTERELQVMELVAHGLTNTTIAQRLAVAEATAKTHLNRLMAKLELSSRAQVVSLAYATGLVSPLRAVRQPNGGGHES